MAKYQVTTDGGTYEVETADDNSPQWSDLPGNAIQGLKEAPQTALGIADQAIKGQDLINPASYVRSGVQALQGTPLADTDTGKAVSAVGQGIGHTIDTIKGLPDVASHPLQSLKNEVIQHPIGTAANVAGLALGVGGLGEDALDTAGQYAGRFGENQAVKALGGSGGQIRDLGMQESRDLARRATKDYGLLDGSMGPIGREETVKSMGEAAGHEIGDIRDSASKAGQALQPSDVEAQIRASIGDKYTGNGVYSGEASGFEKALNEIKALKDPTYSDYSQKASDLNHYAAGNKMTQATNAETDVANQLAHLNDKGITEALPDMADQYEGTKGVFQDMKNLEPMIERGESRQMASRGANTFFEQGKKFTEELGAHKLGAHVGFGAESALKGASAAVRPMGSAAITANIMTRIQTDPRSLGKFAAPLMQAAQSGGSQGIAATHYVLSLQHPEYNQMWKDQEDQ